MLIRKNTKELKAIVQIFNQHKNSKIINNFFKLFIVKAGEKIDQKIAIDSIKENKEFYWESTLESIIANLHSKEHQLQYDEHLKIYFFHTGQNKTWDQTPFQISDTQRKNFDKLASLLPKQVKKTESIKKPHIKNSKWLPGQEVQVSVSKIPPQKDLPKAKANKIDKVVSTKKILKPLRPEKPLFTAKHNFSFTQFETIIFPDLGLSKKDILTYYNQISSLILPFVKDRPLNIKLKKSIESEHQEYNIFKEFEKNLKIKTPGWVKSNQQKYSTKNSFILCPDQDHLLFFVESGCIEFNAWQTKVARSNNPTHLVLELNHIENDFTLIIEVAKQCKNILDGLCIPCYVKTSGGIGLQIYISLDGNSSYEESFKFIEIICQIINLKTKAVTYIEGLDELTHGKINLDYSLNHSGKFAISPYSICLNNWAGVSTPLKWEELKSNLNFKNFNCKSIPKRIKNVGDLFSPILKISKINANKGLKELKERYSFLI